MNERELGTVLAALRHWQKATEQELPEIISPLHFGNGLSPLSAEEINMLAGWLNCQLECALHSADGPEARIKKNRGRKYKAWISVEAINERAGTYLDLMDLGFLEPISLGQFPSLRDALRHILGLPGVNADPGDWSALSRAGAIECEIWKEHRASSPPRFSREEAQQPIGREAKAEYLSSGGIHCPFCHSFQIEGDSFECDSGVVLQEIRCLDCHRRWEDVYKLHDIQFPDRLRG